MMLDALSFVKDRWIREGPSVNPEKAPLVSSPGIITLMI